MQDSRELNEWWNDSRALVVLVDPVPALSSTFHMWCENIGGSLLPPTDWRSKLIQSSRGLAEEVKVRFGGQNDYPSAAWARVKDLPCREESWWDLKKKETSVTCKS